MVASNHRDECQEVDLYIIIRYKDNDYFVWGDDEQMMNDVGQDYNFLYPSIFIIDDLVNKIQVLYYLAEDIYLMHNHKVDYNDVREVFHIYDGAILSD